MPLTLAVLACVVAYLDSWPVGQFQLGRPVLLLPLLGLAIGHPWVGLWLGLVLETLTLRSLPMGNALPPDPGLGGLWALLGLKLGDAPPLDMLDRDSAVAAALLLAVPLSWLAPWLTEAQRRINGKLWRPRFELAVEAGDTRAIGWLMGKVLAQTALLAALVSTVVLLGIQAGGVLWAVAGREMADDAARYGGVHWLLVAVAVGGLWRHAGGRAGSRPIWLGALAGGALALAWWLGGGA